MCDSNFAGIVGPLDMTWDTDTEKFRRVVEVNSIGLWICNKHELKQMIKQSSIEVYVVQASEVNHALTNSSEQGRVPQQGSIVNCASVNSIMAGPGTTGYSAAKHSVNGITKAVSLLLYPVSAHVHCLTDCRRP